MEPFVSPNFPSRKRRQHSVLYVIKTTMSITIVVATIIKPGDLSSVEIIAADHHSYPGCFENL